MEDERQPPPPAAATVSKVLDVDDLLIEILLRVGFPTILVRTALVCKRWLGHVSDRAFLRRFRELHPPRLLGCYIEDMALQNPTRFVPMLPQPPELAAVFRRASFSLDAYNTTVRYASKIQDCRNGSVFTRSLGRECGSIARVHSPLHPQRGLTILPSNVPRQPEGNSFCIFKQILSQEDGHGMSYFCLYVEAAQDTLESGYTAHVYKLQDGSCHSLHSLDLGQLPRPGLEPKAVLVDNKIYLAAGLSDIIVLDLKASSFSTIQLPQEVDHSMRGTTMLSPADDASGLYLIHAKEFQLRVWLHKGDDWMLVDSICLHEMCVNLKNSGCAIEDEHTPLLMSQVVDYGDFLFLEMGGCALQFDIKCRTLRKIYETEDGCLGNIYPFMMIWPPTFPALKYESARNAT